MSDRKPTDHGDKQTRKSGSPSRKDQDQQVLVRTPKNVSSIARQLTGGQSDVRSILSGMNMHQPLEAERASQKINSLILETGGRGSDQRNLTQGAEAWMRQGSPSKQSVLVKRVMQDGRVVSALDSMRGISQMNKRLSEPRDEETATLGSRNGSCVDKKNNIQNARESGIVNQGTQLDSSEANKLRSTMYMTGKSQRFPHGVDKLQAGSSIMGITGNSMVINLGERERTETNNFGNVFNAQDSANEVDMVVGMADIVTGAVRIQNTNSSQFAIPPSNLINHNSQSIYNSSDFKSSIPMMHATLASMGTHQKDNMSQPNENGGEKTRASIALDSCGMQIQSISPLSMKRRSGKALANEPNIVNAQRGGQTSDSLLLQGQSLATMMHESYKRRLQMAGTQQTSPVKRPELTGISVTIVDARSMIPSQPIPKELMHGQERRQTRQHLKQSKRDSRSPKANNSELKRFHKATAQQYKDFMKQQRTHEQFRISQQERARKNYSSKLEKHDNSQSTLMDFEAMGVDNSLDLKPGQINQGTEIMMKSLEHEILQLKSVGENSMANFYTPKTGVAKVDNNEAFLVVTNNVVATDAKEAVYNQQMLDTIRSENLSTEKKVGLQTLQNFNTRNDLSSSELMHQQANLTFGENYSRLTHLTSNDNPIVAANQKMLQTYRGADNMKLKIIDQSVLKTYASLHQKAGGRGDENLKSSPSRASDPNVTKMMMDEGCDSPKRKSIIFDTSSLNIDHREHHMHHQQLQGILGPSYLSPYESSIMQKASPMSKIESFRALLRQESAANDQKIMTNQDNFKNLINPAVTRKEYQVFDTKPSQNDLNINQNQKKEDGILHTNSNEFSPEENLNTTMRSAIKQSQSPRSMRITMDVKNFRQQLAKKIEEIRLISDPASPDWQGEQRTAQMSSHESGSRKGSLKLGGAGVRKFSLDEQERIANDHNLFMTYLQHEQSKNRVDFAQDLLKEKRPTEHNIDFGKLELPVLSPQYAAIQGSEKSSKKRGGGPFKGEHDLVSFADQASANGRPTHQKSGVTLASSGSSKTVKRIAKRYMREHRIVVFEDGAEMSETTPVVVVELNSLLRKHYLQQNGSSSYTTQQDDINAQIVIYERAVREILDMCGMNLIVDGELSPEQKNELHGAAPKRFNQLYTVFGDPVNSLLHIDEECCILVAGQKDQFSGLETSHLFKYEESANYMLNRIVEQSPITFDYKSVVQKVAHSATISAEKFKSPFARKNSNESLCKTFALTQQSGIFETEPVSPKKGSSPAVRASLNGRRGVSLTSRDIIKASKAELMKRFATKGSMSQRTSGSNMPSKRLTSINMVTKAIKLGKLPPIQTPSQLDVFVFGEHQQRQGMVSPSLPIQPQPLLSPLPQQPIQPIVPPHIVRKRVQKTLTIMETANEGHIDHDNVSMVQTEISAADMMRKKRGTQAQLRTREQYVDSIKEQQQFSSGRNKSSMGMSQSPIVEYDFSERGKEKVTAVSLRRNLDAVNSVQMMEESKDHYQVLGAPSTGSYHTEQMDKFRQPKCKITARNMGIARMAIKERSPSYISKKLVSQTSIADSKKQKRNNTNLTQRQKDKIKAEANEHVLQNAIKQRQLWKEEFSLDDRQLFSLFSEFSSMMQINRIRENDAEEDSLAKRMRQENSKTGEDDEKLSALFPMGANISSTKYNLMKLGEKHKLYKLPQEDQVNFRVPVQVCIDYSEVLRPTKTLLRAIVLNAFGVLADYAKSTLTMDQFLRINSFLRFGHHTIDEFIWFCVKLFDPQLNGYRPIKDCCSVVDLLFDNQDEDGKTTKAPGVKLPEKIDVMEGENTQSAGDVRASNMDIGSQSKCASIDGQAVTGTGQDVKSQDGDKTKTETTDENGVGEAKMLAVDNEEAKDESVSANIKKVCHERGIFKADGFLDPNLLYLAFKEGQLDIEDFKSALK